MSGNLAPAQLVEVNTAPSQDQWQPVIGQETEDLLAYFGRKLDPSGRQNLEDASVRIIRRCVSPTGPPADTTGLVVGYVQSGKTMSFTTVSALAADNGYPLIFVITGTTNNLSEQSAQRLRQDLRLETRPDRKWQHFHEPKQPEADRLNRILEEWRDASVPVADRRVALITLKKNWGVLRQIITLLGRLNLSGIPALIIDDEADQASLNTRVQQDEESTTYVRLKQLRELFPRHTFLQYTATPQANLLIHLLDVLSPDFAELLSPGEDYTGGIEFFGDDHRLIRIIPSDETPTRQNPITELPPSLKEAMKVFFIGVAAGYVLGESNRGNRTMLIHPSRETSPQGDFAHWAKQLRQNWEQILGLPSTELDQIELLAEFRAAYDDTASTVGTAMPPWDAIATALRRAIRMTNVVEVNSTPRRTTEIRWLDDYAWILVGGQALDRGFTVEGLTVTYMPRGLGMGNADTLQQRARFFGYKRRYLGYCRIYLDSDVVDAFTEYVTHEEHLRQQLDQFRATELPLNQWKRAFFMSRNMQPTRSNVLSLSHMRDSFSDRWFWVRCPQELPSIVETNRAVFSECVSQRAFAPLPAELYGQPATRHSAVIGVPLLEVYDSFLVQVGVAEADDSQAYSGVMMQIAHYLQNHPDELCDIYLMNASGETQRAINSTTKKIDNIFQGSNRQPGDSQYYPGDREIHAPDRLCIHLRRLDLTENNQTVATDVPDLAIWIPEKMEQDWLVQEPQ